MSTIVRTQAELDAAINAGAENIIIDSPAADHLPRREPPR